MKLAIFDFDGVLVDSSHRYKLDAKTGRIDLEHWRKNSTPEQIRKDKFLPLVLHYQALLRNPAYIVAIGTARVVCKTTMETIAKIGKPDILNGRDTPENPRSGALYKMDILNLVPDAETVEFYDDNPEYLETMKQARPDVKTFWIKSEQGY